jgi:hypothetical protein
VLDGWFGAAWRLIAEFSYSEKPAGMDMLRNRLLWPLRTAGRSEYVSYQLALICGGQLLRYRCIWVVRVIWLVWFLSLTGDALNVVDAAANLGNSIRNRSQIRCDQSTAKHKYYQPGRR